MRLQSTSVVLPKRACRDDAKAHTVQDRLGSVHPAQRPAFWRQRDLKRLQAVTANAEYLLEPASCGRICLAQTKALELKRNDVKLLQMTARQSQRGKVKAADITAQTAAR